MSGFAASHLLADQHVPFDYSDLVPVPQDDGPHPVVAIAYSADYTRRMDLFRAVLQRCELSPRVLCLTEELLHDNASNYTVWQYRRECLRALSCDLGRELDYLDSNPDDNPKNYQIWHHRRVVVEELASLDPSSHGGERELAFTSEVFEVDPKNYHAWAHRQWACQRFGLWAGELGFSEALLRQDVRNNSAWNHRWFVVHRGKTALAGESGAARLPALSPEEAAAEVDFCFARIDEARRNESPWNYLRGLVQHHSTDEPGPESIVATARSRVQALVGGGESGNPLAVSFLADMLLAEGTRAAADKAAGGAGARALLEDAVGWFALLGSIDGIRAKAWEKRRAAAQALALSVC